MVYVGIIGQSIAAVVLIVAVTLQVSNNADIGNLIVSIGAVLFAIFTKIRLVGYEWDELITRGKKRRSK